MKKALVLSIVALSVLVGSLALGAARGATVTLPPGDITKGKAAFAAMRCYTCHEVAGSEFPKPWASPAADMKLGGALPARDPSSIATSIVDPNHAISGDPKKTTAGGASRMGDFTDVLTVRQLADITAYLHSTYEKR